MHPAPTAGPSVEWPVWVGGIPRLAAAFQPRTEVRDKAGAARAGGSDVVLSGPGGVGKSQLAASLARELRDRERSGGAGVDVLVWVRATGIDQVITAYAEAAVRLDLPGVSPDDEEGAARVFLHWLASTERGWLVVLDDLTDLAPLREWWPDSGGGRGWVLATTRREDAQLSGQGRTLFRLGLYTDAESRAYLRRRLTDAGQDPLYDQEHADEVATELGHLPLALGHAAAYLINKHRTMADYLNQLHDAGSRLGDLLPPSADAEDYGRPVTASLLLSLAAVQESDTSALALPLLRLVSLMDPLGHPAALWTTPAVLDHLRTARPPRRRRLRRQHPAVTAAEVHGALESLRVYALITQDTATAPIRIHALTARAAREPIPSDMLPVAARAVADAMVSLWPSHDHEERELSAALRANTVKLDKLTRPALWHPNVHSCIYQVSSSFTQAGLYQQAVEYDETTVLQSTRVHGPDHPDTLNACRSLASSYSEAGRVQDALALRERVLTYRERILGNDHPDTLIARYSLASSYSEAGRVQDALTLRERVLTDYEQILGNDHPYTLNARHSLAISYSEAGRVQDALTLCERVLTDYEQILGNDHPDTLNARHNLASSYSEAGRVQDSLTLRERVLTDYEQVLGNDHPDTLTARHSLASSYSEAGRVQDALTLRERVLTDYEQILGNDHPYTLNARHNLASSYSEAGRAQDALDLCERVLTDYEQVLGNDHPDTLSARHSLAISYSEAGRVQDALTLRERVLTDYERILGNDHPDTLNARHNLAISYSEAGRAQDALDLCERVLTDYEQILGNDHPYTLSARHNLAISYSEAGRAQDALTLRERILTDYERILGNDHPDTLNARHNLARLRDAADAVHQSDTAAPETP
ncbi:tetratricopeptide repeat protein [Streptomyces microflavus]|uniref:tetratricopeptide repeat protein n=1 Tax=Streptomyces microflavus TaxID=1919 RepID=UPI003456AF3E